MNPRRAGSDDTGCFLSLLFLSPFLLLSLCQNFLFHLLSNIFFLNVHHTTTGSASRRHGIVGGRKCRCWYQRQAGTEESGTFGLEVQLCKGSMPPSRRCSQKITLQILGRRRSSGKEQLETLKCFRFDQVSLGTHSAGRNVHQKNGCATCSILPHSSSCCVHINTAT